MAKLSLALFVAVLLLATPAKAQQADDPVAWADNFLRVLVNDGPDKAATILNEETFLGQQVRTLAPILREGAQKAVNTFGTTTGFEKARENALGSRLIRLTYIVHHVHMAVQYRFFFYRTDRGWNLVGTNIEGEAVKFDFSN